MVQDLKSLISYFPEFIVYKKERNASINTLKSYQRILSYFSYWLKENNLYDISPENLSVEIIQRYIAHLASRVNFDGHSPVSPKTQNNYLIVVRSFLLFLLSDTHIRNQHD